MGAQGKRPEDYGIRVRNNSSEMGITAANKMRNTKAKIDRKSFYGSVFETPYLHRSLSAVSENIDHTSAFLREFTVAQKDDSVQHPYFRDISARRVIFDDRIQKSLKKLYQYRCQVCGATATVMYGVDVTEAHHLNYFSKTANNNPGNIVILCPDHHRIVHKAKAIFNYELHQFEYENARIDPLMYNLHL